jgi:hypothetical protein
MGELSHTTEAELPSLMWGIKPSATRKPPLTARNDHGKRDIRASSWVVLSCCAFVREQHILAT